MLIVETIARIRREHFIKGKTIKEIARDLKVSRNTVRKVLRSGETSFEYERAVQPRPKLGRWAAEPERESRQIFHDQIDPHRQSEEGRRRCGKDDAGRVSGHAVDCAADPCFHSGEVNRSCSPGRGSLSAST